MTTQVGGSLTEGQSTNRPLLFNASNYSYWKARICIFIQVLDYDMWSAIINGPHTSIFIVDSTKKFKSKKDWDEQDKKLTQLNVKVMNVLYCALDANEFNQISTYNSVKKI